jgi:hypothetical protein
MIEFITPVPRSTIGKGASVSFTVGDTYSALQIHVEISDAMVLAYDASVGPSAGYQVKVAESGANHVYTITRDAGWVHSPTIIQVTEDEDTDTNVTVFSYDLPGVVKFPRLNNPKTVGFPKVRVSEDDGTAIEEVEWIDIVSGTPPDGMTATSEGPPTAHISALAATTDPDAIHVSTDGEIDPITEKAPPNSARADWMIIEDSAASFVKKKALVSNVIPAPVPSRLENDLNCQLLYLWGGNLNYETDGPLSYTGYDPINNVSVNRRILFDNVSGEAEGTLIFNDTGKMNSWSLSGAANDPGFNVQGAMTVQWVGTLPKGGSVGTGGVTLWAYKQQNAFATDVVWGLQLWNEDSGPRTVDDYMPRFCWTDSGGVALYTTYDPNFRLSPYMKYHIVGRRVADGAGTYTSSLWVNGLKIAEETLQPLAYASVGAHRLVAGSDVGAERLARTQHFGSKFSNAALSDDQIRSEYKKALGYP